MPTSGWWFMVAAAVAISAWRWRRAPKSRAGLVIAHRGASGLAPENTLTALRHSATRAAGWAEVDVQRTADGILVLVHDDTWERTTGFAGEVRATPWDTVRGLDAGSWFGAAFAGESPPRLEQALELAVQGLHLNLELKSPALYPGLGGEVVAAVRRAGVVSRVLITSFDADLIEALAAAAPDLEFGYLSTSPVRREHPAVRTLALHHAVVEADPGLVRTARAARRRVLVWTVDDPAQAARLVGCGVHGIITNHPERFAAALRTRW